MYFYEKNFANGSGIAPCAADNAKKLFHAPEIERPIRFSDYGAPKPMLELERRDLDVVVEERVRSIVLFLGFNPKNKGFSLAVTGCIEAYKKPVLLDKMSKNFYPLLAELCDTTPQRAERCIRHELLKCYESGVLKNMNALFKMHLWNEKERMSNGDFFSLVVQKLCMELGEYK